MNTVLDCSVNMDSGCIEKMVGLLGNHKTRRLCKRNKQTFRNKDAIIGTKKEKRCLTIKSRNKKYCKQILISVVKFLLVGCKLSGHQWRTTLYATE